MPIDRRRLIIKTYSNSTKNKFIRIIDSFTGIEVTGETETTEYKLKEDLIKKLEHEIRKAGKTND